MPEHGVLPEVLERFLDEPIPSPPLTDIRAQGDAVRRRRRRGAAVAGAAVLVIAGSAFAGQTLFGDGSERLDDPAPAPVTTLEPPAGTRWAGIGRVVLAVPGTWSDGQVACNVPFGDTVYFPAEELEQCIPGDHSPASSLAISDKPFMNLIDLVGTADGELGGHSLHVTREACTKSIPGTCSMDLAIPDLGAYFRITAYSKDAEAQVQEIRDTLTLLPDGQASVPLIEGWRQPDIDDAVEAMLELGLDPAIEEGCNDAGLCEIGAWTVPAAGRVVATGSQVTIYVAGWGDGSPDPYPVDALTCHSDYQRSVGTIDVIPPSSPQQAREQGWPTGPLEAVDGVPTAPAWRHLGIVDLTVLDPVDDGVTRVSGQDAEGRTVLIMTVRELVPGAWAMTGTETCG